MSTLDAYLSEHEERHLQEFFDLLRIPSISTDPTHAGDVREAAQFLVDQFNGLGIKAEVCDTEGHPIVYAEWLNAPEKPTVLFYGHYDVQPADPIELWDSPPFEPTIRNDAIYARGASDDKGQVFGHIKALEAIVKTEGTLPINLKFVIEGEEESGSSSLEPFLTANKARLEADVVVVSDTGMLDPETPAICYGLRGMAYHQINLQGPSRDLHSGMYGGAVDNPINAMCHLVSKLKDEKGVIQIPGFYDDVAELSESDRAEFERVPFDEEGFLGEIDSAAYGEPGYSTLERLGGRPTLDVNGMWGGYTGEGAKTVLPAKAHAKISMRLVPKQDPNAIARQFEAFVREIAPPTVKVDVESMHGAQPSITDRTSPYVQATVRAISELFGKAPVFTRAGGSIPVVASFKNILGLDTILAGFALPDDRIHSPNEKFDLNSFRAVARFGVRVWHELAKI